MLVLGQEITGTVFDNQTKESLPFATVAIKGISQGTIANQQGNFNLRVPSSIDNPILIVSFLGYHTKEVSVSDNALQIGLETSILELKELIVNPLPPTAYIKRAVRKIPDNYARNPFESRAHYREIFKENGNYVNGSEAYFKSYYPSYEDTTENQHQLLLYRQAEDLQDIAFAKKWIEKRTIKENRKAKKKGEEPDEIDPTGEIRKGFGGPDNILSLDFNEELADCLDSTLFKKFKYEFGDGIRHYGREMMVINFESKGKVDHTRQEGKIYLDIDSDAIVAVEYSGKAIIPAVVRPILFAVGLKIVNPDFAVKIKYQPIGDKWYPQNFQWGVDLDMTKRYMWSSNESSSFFVQQLMTVNEVLLEKVSQVPDEKLFKPRQDMQDQTHNDYNITWEMVNTLIP